MSDTVMSTFVKAAGVSFVILFWAKLHRSKFRLWSSLAARSSISTSSDPCGSCSSRLSSTCSTCTSSHSHAGPPLPNRCPLSPSLSGMSYSPPPSPSRLSASHSCPTPFSCSCPYPDSCSSVLPDEKFPAHILVTPPHPPTPAGAPPPNNNLPPPANPNADFLYLRTPVPRRKCSPHCRLSNTEWNRKCVVVLVGLPARGKSYIAKKLINFLRWQGIEAKMFNVGAHRRDVAAENGKAQQSAAFFDPKNTTAAEQREAMALSVLTTLLQYLAGGGDLGIFDATNTTAARRRQVMRMCEQTSPLLNVVFVECICDDPAVIRSNLLAKIRNSPDFKHMTESAALADLTDRVANYQKVYETIIESENLAYIKIINLRSQIICNGIHGKLPQLIALVLMSAHIHPRPIYLTRAGYSTKIGDTTLFLELHEALGEKDLRKSKKFVPTPALDAPTPMGMGRAPSGGNLLVPPGEVASDVSSPHFKATGTMHASLSKDGQIYASRLAKFISVKSQEFMKKMQQTVEANPNVIGYRAVLLKQSMLFKQGGRFSTLHDPNCEAADDDSQDAETSSERLPLAIYTSTHMRAVQTAAKLIPQALQCSRLASLNILNTGVFYNKSAEYLARTQAAELQHWKDNPFRYRFPEGESQLDQAEKLVPLIIDLERQLMPVLVVSHSSTLQVVYGYFAGLEPKEFSMVDLPIHTVIEFMPSQYGWQETWYELSSDEFPQGVPVSRNLQFYDTEKK